MNEKQKFLNEQEHSDYMNEISSVMTDLIGKVVFIADKHNVDRDNAMQHFSTLLSTMVQVSTFEHYGEGGA